MKLWMAVTPDEYELPLAVAKSHRELAGMLGANPVTIQCQMRRAMHGVKGCSGKRRGYALRMVKEEEVSQEKPGKEGNKMARGVRTDKRIERLVRVLLETGKSQNQVARTLGISCGVVNRIASETQYEVAGQKSRMPEELLRQWDYLHERYGKKR